MRLYYAYLFTGQSVVAASAIQYNHFCHRRSRASSSGHSGTVGNTGRTRYGNPVGNGNRAQAGKPIGERRGGYQGGGAVQQPGEPRHRQERHRQRQCDHSSRLYLFEKWRQPQAEWLSGRATNQCAAVRSGFAESDPEQNTGTGYSEYSAGQLRTA